MVQCLPVYLAPLISDECTDKQEEGGFGHVEIGDEAVADHEPVTG